MDLLGQEVSPDGRLVLVRELLANVLVHQGGLADAAGGGRTRRNKAQGKRKKEEARSKRWSWWSWRRRRRDATKRGRQIGSPSLGGPRTVLGPRADGGRGGPSLRAVSPPEREGGGRVLSSGHSPAVSENDHLQQGALARSRHLVLVLVRSSLSVSLCLSLCLCLRLSKRFAGFTCCLSCGCGGCRNPKFQKI